MRRLAIIAAMTASLALTFTTLSLPARACGGSNDAKTSAKKRTAKGISTVVLAIEGMSCGGCAKQIASKLRRMDGVRAAEVDFDKRQASVHFQSEKVTVAKLISEVRNLGYKASVVRRG